MGQAAGELQTSGWLWQKSVSRWDGVALPLASSVSLSSAVNGASWRPRAPSFMKEESWAN